MLHMNGDKNVRRTSVCSFAFIVEFILSKINAYENNIMLSLFQFDYKNNEKHYFLSMTWIEREKEGHMHSKWTFKRMLKHLQVLKDPQKKDGVNEKMRWYMRLKWYMMRDGRGEWERERLPMCYYFIDIALKRCSCSCYYFLLLFC